MSYYELLRKYIKESGLSLSEISVKLEPHGYKVSKGYISQLQNGKTDNPATTELNRALAAVTGGDVEQLLTAALLEKAPEEIKEKIIKLNKLKELKKDLNKALVIEETPAQYIAENLVKVPLLGSIAAGQPVDRIELIEDIEYINKSVVRGHEAFCLRVKGDSMIGDNIAEGDIVVCIKQNEVTSTDIAIVAIEGETATVKRIKCEGNICILMPSNPKLQPIIVESSKVEVIGKVVELRRRF